MGEVSQPCSRPASRTRRSRPLRVTGGANTQARAVLWSGACHGHPNSWATSSTPSASVDLLAVLVRSATSTGSVPSAGLDLARVATDAQNGARGTVSVVGLEALERSGPERLLGARVGAGSSSGSNTATAPTASAVTTAAASSRRTARRMRPRLEAGLCRDHGMGLNRAMSAPRELHAAAAARLDGRASGLDAVIGGPGLSRDRRETFALRLDRW